MTEEWRPIPGWDGYEASSLGRIASRRRQTPVVLKPSVSRKGYLHVGPSRDGRNHTQYVHNLVALAFIGPKPTGLEVRHLDGDRTNNAASNIAYGTKAENAQDAIKHGTHSSRMARCHLGHALSKANARRDETGAVWCCKCLEMVENARRNRAAS